MSRSVRKSLSIALIAALTLVMAVPGAGIAVTSDAASVSPQSVIFWEDAFESDDTTAAAVAAPEVSFHTFHEIGDIDMVMISAEESGTLFTLETEFVAASNGENDDDYGDFDTEISVLDSDGVTVIANNDDSDSFSTYSSSLVFQAPHAGTFYVQVNELTPDDRGAYTLYVNEGMGHRVYGADRYATAAAVSHRIHDSAQIWGSENTNIYDAVVASGENFADAITGSILAAAYDAPLLLTKKSSFPAASADELARFFSGPSMYHYEYETTVHVVGGPSAVATEALAGIGMVETVSNVEIVSGATRYETAAEVAQVVEDEDGASVAYVVNGDAWADAIAVASVAPFNSGIILLTKTASVPQVTLDTLTAIGITDVVIVGGEAVVSEDAADELRSVVGTASVERIAGDNRYETARLVAEHGVDDMGMAAECTLLASGESFPDALSAGTLSWWLETPVLLTRKNVLSGDAVMFLEDYGPIPALDYVEYAPGTFYDARQGSVSYLIGGSAAISDDVYHEWRGMFFNAP